MRLRLGDNRETAALAALIGLLIVSSSMAMSSADAYALAAQGSSPSTPIKHIVIIMQENHSFDSLFGTFPGLAPGYSLPLNDCIPKNLTSPDGCILPWNADSQSASFQKEDLCHSPTCMQYGYNHGEMNGFYAGQVLSDSAESANAKASMGYLTGKTVPDYWDFASKFALDANFFSSVLSNSYPNHLYNIAANGCYACGCPAECMFNLTIPTIVTELNASKVTWRYFTGDFNDGLQCTNITSWEGLGTGLSGSYWNVLPDFPSIQDSQSTCHDIQNFGDLYNDLSIGYLPEVSWIMPNYTVSDHPGGDAPLPRGQEYVSQIVDQIENNPTLWSSTAIFITYDEGGGYFDNVAPTTVSCSVCSADRYGFRVPLIVISPYVKPGIYYGDPVGAQEDFSALLKTIEVNWGLAPLTARDASVPSLFYMFDFNQKPLPPLILPTNSLATYPVSTCSTCHIGAVPPRQFVPTKLTPVNASAVAAATPGNDESTTRSFNPNMVPTTTNSTGNPASDFGYDG